MSQEILPSVGKIQITHDSFGRIGKHLQSRRKERGLRLADVARELRISADYLRLLEAGDFDQLPAPTYVSGFLRSYGKFLDLDAADLAGRFYAIEGEVLANKSETTKKREDWEETKHHGKVSADARRDRTTA